MSESILWNEMGNLHMRLGSFEEAASAYGRAIEIAPDFSLAYSNLGHAFLSKGDYEGAIPLFNRSIELSSSAHEQATAWKRMGDAYQKRGDYDKALAAYKRGDELEALADIGLINPFADLAVNTTPDPIILEAVEPEPDTRVDLVKESLGGIEQSDEMKNEDDNEIEESTDEPGLPVVPPFFPALDISEEEFQAPEPMKQELSADEIETVVEEPSISSTHDEEYSEFNDWLKSLDKKPVRISSTGYTFNRGEKQPDASQPTRVIRVNMDANPSRAGSFTMLETESDMVAIPVLTDQELWGAEDSDAQNQDQAEYPIISAQDVSAIPLVEAAQPGKATELFKSWRISEEPEHDPSVWKAMLEALEKKEASKVEEVVQETTPPPITDNPSLAPVKKAVVSRELMDGIVNYKKITSMAPLNDKAWDSLGKLLKDAGEFNEAVDAFQHAISICPGKDLYHYHLGLVFAAQKKHEDAIDAFKKVVEINPGYTLAHCALAGSYRRLGLETEANAHIKVALPRLDMETEYNRACFEAICGNTDQAIELLRQALEMKQTSPEWVRGDPDLDFIRDDPRFQELVGM